MLDLLSLTAGAFLHAGGAGALLVARSWYMYLLPNDGFGGRNPFVSECTYQVTDVYNQRFDNAIVTRIKHRNLFYVCKILAFYMYTKF